ncbi:hypothetical protein PRZ48_012652 [Zasmidium cellare]|uniref:Uncharacterized protein n=1 Tax=Zasmidium cellare TaxID=395010 RepID=A0ABR0E5G5_ZASCE|nr:hypothetical protein PRZ48_012652 [Zasmidium cellare]
MDYIIPAVLLGTRPATDSSRNDSPPPYELVDPEMAQKRAYIERIQYCQTAGTFILLPVMLVLQVPFLRFSDKHFSPSVAKAIGTSYLRGRLAGSLAFAVADIVPYTGLEVTSVSSGLRVLEFEGQGTDSPAIYRKFLGDAAVLLWTIYEEERERAKLETAQKKAKPVNTPEEEEAALLALRGAASWDI